MASRRKISPIETTILTKGDGGSAIISRADGGSSILTQGQQR